MDLPDHPNAAALLDGLRAWSTADLLALLDDAGAQTCVVAVRAAPSTASADGSETVS